MTTTSTTASSKPAAAKSKASKPAAAKSKASKPAKLKHMSRGEYKGNALLQFHESEDPAKEADRYPFQFGQGKAKKMLNAIEANGIEAFVAELKSFVDG